MPTFLIWLSISPFLFFFFYSSILFLFFFLFFSLFQFVSLSFSSSLSMLYQTNSDVIFCFTRIDCQIIIQIWIFYNIQYIQIRITIWQSIGVKQNVHEFTVFQKEINFIYIGMLTFLIWLFSFSFSFSLSLSSFLCPFLLLFLCPVKQIEMLYFASLVLTVKLLYEFVYSEPVRKLYTYILLNSNIQFVINIAK